MGHGTRMRLGLAGLLALLLAPSSAAWGQTGTGTLVQFDFGNFGQVQIDLFDDLVPATVANYLQYIHAGTYQNSMVHRVDTQLGVVQGGGYNAEGVVLSAFDPIALQYSRANTRGTIGAARTSDTLAGTTSQWFINTQDNSTTLGPSNDGGYAVFGWVVGTGMSVIDSIAAVPTFEYEAPFGQIPLTDFTQADYDNDVDPLPHLVTLPSVTVVKTHPAYQNPLQRWDTNNDGQVQARDVLVTINALLSGGAQPLTAAFAGTNYVDVNGDGRLTATDVLNVINYLLAESAPSATTQAEIAAPMAVPEPESWLLAAMGGLLAILKGFRRVGRIC